MRILLPSKAPVISGWTVAEHIPRTEIDWNCEYIRFISDGVRSETFADKLPAPLLRERHSLLNACMLEHLLNNPQLVPDEWAVFEGVPGVIGFFGTTYKSCNGAYYVRALSIHPGQTRRLQEVVHWMGHGILRPHRAILMN